MVKRRHGDEPIADVELGPLVRETDDACLFKVLGAQGGKKVWLPKRYIEREHNKAGDTWTVTMPEWLAIEKELV